MKKSELIAQLQADIAAFGDGEVGETTLKGLASLTEEQKIARGKLFAEVFKLKKDPEHKDRFQTTVGTKTALGVFVTAKRMVEEVL